MLGWIFLYFTASRPALGPPIQWIPVTISMGGKWLEHETELSQSSAKVKNGAAIPLIPANTFMVCLIE
jgi:hypothetical protein